MKNEPKISYHLELVDQLLLEVAPLYRLGLLGQLADFELQFVQKFHHFLGPAFFSMGE